MKDHFVEILLAFIVLVQVSFNFLIVKYFFTGIWSTQLTMNTAFEALNRMDERGKESRKK